MKAKKPTAKQLDKLIEQIYYRRCNGVQINIMDIGKVFKAGQAAYLAAMLVTADVPAALLAAEDAIVKFVDSIRQSDVRPSGLETVA